jgi:ribonuclease R
VQDVDRLFVLGEHCSQREQRAAAAERELIKVKLLEHLEQHIGMEMDAVVTGVERFGLFVQGLALPAEGLVPIHSLQDDHYVFDRASHSLTGRRRDNAYRLGDLVHVEVAHVDIDNRELDFRLLGRLERPPRLARPAGKKRPVKPAAKQKKPRAATRSDSRGKQAARKKTKGKAGKQKSEGRRAAEQKSPRSKTASPKPAKSKRRKRRNSSKK